MGIPDKGDHGALPGDSESLAEQGGDPLTEVSRLRNPASPRTLLLSALLHGPSTRRDGGPAAGPPGNQGPHGYLHPEKTPSRLRGGCDPCRTSRHTAVRTPCTFSTVCTFCTFCTLCTPCTPCTLCTARRYQHACPAQISTADSKTTASTPHDVHLRQRSLRWTR